MVKGLLSLWIMPSRQLVRGAGASGTGAYKPPGSGLAPLFGKQNLLHKRAFSGTNRNGAEAKQGRVQGVDSPSSSSSTSSLPSSTTWNPATNSATSSTATSICSSRSWRPSEHSAGACPRWRHELCGVQGKHVPLDPQYGGGTQGRSKVGVSGAPPNLVPADHHVCP